MSIPMERLSPDDTRILRLESDLIAGHTLKLVVVAPRRDGRPLTVEDVRTRVEARLPDLPRARQRLAPTPLRIATPAWVDDESFDIRNHVRPASEPIGDRAALVRFVGNVMAKRLDHDRPLWCIDVVAPGAHGRTALVVRIHHCLADGVTCLRMLSELLWDRDDGVERRSAETWRPNPAPSKARLLASGAGTRLHDIGSAFAGGARAAVSPRRWRDPGRKLARLPGTLRRELWPLGADTAFDRRISANREVAFTACELDDLKRIEHAAGSGVTVNDILLAVVAGAIRRWLGTHHEQKHTMRVQIPVSMHHRDEDRELGNRDSFLFCDLPIAEPDPRKRLAAINAETRSRNSITTPTSSTPSSTACPTSHRFTGSPRSWRGGPREFALSVSNVPGPREPVTVLGGRVAELYSAAEPADRHALRASAVSLAGRMGFGFCTDPGAVPGVGELAEGLDASLEELRELV